MNKLEKLIGQKGSMMVEALAMLGLITMVTPVLYKKAAERTTELQDINTANQMRTISKAMDDYIQDHYATLSTGPNLVKLETTDIEPYLPYGFNLDDSKLLGEYQMALRKDTVGEGDKTRASITGMVVANPRQDLSMMRASKIASMIGSNGGLVQADGSGKVISGVGGGWSAKESDYGFTTGDPGSEVGTLTAGGIAVGSINAIISDSGGANERDVLYRNNSKGTEANTMETTLYLGENDIEDINNMITKTAMVTSSSANALQVQGGANIVSTLQAGAANILNNLDVQKVLTVKGNADFQQDVNIGNAVKVGTGGADIGGNTKVSGTLGVTGDTTLSGKLDVDKATNLKGATVIGTDTTIGSQMLNVKGDANIQGSLTISNDFSAPNIYGTTSLRGGRLGAAEENRYNFAATGAAVTIANNNMTVGDMLVIGTNTARLALNPASPTQGFLLDRATGKLSMEASGAGIYAAPNSVQLTTAATGSIGLNRGSSQLDINSSGSVLMQSEKDMSLKGNAGAGGRVSLGADAKMTTGNDTAAATNPYVGVSSTGARLGAPNTAFTKEPQVQVASSGEISITGANLMADTYNFYTDADKMIFADATKDLVTVSGNTVTSKGVIFRREGNIILPRGGSSGRADLAADKGYQNVAGYIKADRIIANQQYERPGSGVANNNDEPSSTVRYDAYQLNPAYTSVMHDIKLTTRGGARLSDILPDFINRGIYVLDNTYPESKTNPNWETYTVANNSGTLKVTPALGDCNGDADCIATPWLGFVPAPQCPPGYAKVITINPIRWKMSEAYYITGVESVDPDVAIKFRNYFVPQTNPMNAKFTLGESDGSTGMHSHDLSEGGALTFQTNTWLNTTISGYGSGSGFLGWHAIMGFLYYGDQYSEYLTSLGKTGFNGKVIWNLFPVFNEEMSSIANVYCYFERDNVTTSPAWTWDRKYIGTYDQLDSFRSGYDKDSTYKNRLNDPTLGYTEAW